MGQLATTIAGGLLGSVFGPFGAQVGAMLGGMIGATLFGPTIKGPRLTDLKVTASTYGAAIPEIYGTVRLGGNMIWSTGLNETKHKSGGKGGPKQTTYTYDCTFAVGLCKGPIDDILRIWADGKLIYDVSAGATRLNFNGNNAQVLLALSQANSKKKKNVKMRVYRGTEDQLPDSLIEADKGVGNVSGHRGLAYVVFEKLPLEDYGNRVPQLSFEITRNIATNMPNLKASITESDPLPGVTSRQWIPDWELGRLYSFYGDTQTDVLDLNTMERAYTGPGGIGGGYRTHYAMGTGIYFRTAGLSNSNSIQVWDLFTLTNTLMGKNSNSVEGQYLNGCGNIAEQYANLGATGTGFCTSGGSRKMHLMLISWVRSVFAFEYGNPVPLFNTTAAFAPDLILTGKQDAYQSEMISWRNANNRLEMQVWRIDANASSSLVERTPPGSCPAPSYIWEQSTNFTNPVVNLTPFSGEFFRADALLYDPSDDHVFALGWTRAGTGAPEVPCALKYSLQTGMYKFAVKHPGLPLLQQTMRYSRLAGGTFGWGGSAGGVGGNRFWVELDLQTGAVVRQDPISESEFESKFWFGSSQHWDDLSSSLIVQTRENYRRVYFRSGAAKLGVASVVQDVCLRTNVLTAPDLDITELNDDELVGYIIDRETSARDVLKQLATAFLFDGFESDYKLKFRSRGNDSIVTIPESWINRDNDNVVVRETITQELELPLRITVNYYDTARDHQQGSQSMKRNAAPYPTMWTRKEDVIELPISWTPDDAKQCADKLLKMAWANRTAYSFTLPWKYMKYDPTDVVTVNLEDGTVYEIRLSDMTVGADFQIQAAGTSEKAAAYVSNAVGQVSESPLQGIPGAYPAYPIIVNTPLLRDIDYETSGNSTAYAAAGTLALTYSGAQIFMNDGFEYDPVGSTSIEAVTGMCMSALPITSATESTDETTVLKVRLDDATAILESITQDDMLTNYRNAALVGKEVIQFRDAVLQSDGTWHLTGILRARRGTNYAIREHTTGEQFMLLDLGTMVKFIRPPEAYVVTRDFKAISSGTLLEDATAYPNSLVPRDLMPYTPEDIKITDDGTDVTVSMSRRSRVTAPLVGGSGTIHYKEGDKANARITYKIWLGLTIADTNTANAPDKTGNIALFDGSGLDAANQFTFPLTDMGAETKFLLSLAEVGVVEGTPKWVECERIDEALWNITELY